MAKEFMLREEAAQHANERGLPLSKNTLAKFATVGGGPRFQKFGNRAVYTPTDMDAWIEQKLSGSRERASERAA